MQASSCCLQYQHPTRTYRTNMPQKNSCNIFETERVDKAEQHSTASYGVGHFKKLHTLNISQKVEECIHEE